MKVYLCLTTFSCLFLLAVNISNIQILSKNQSNFADAVVEIIDKIVSYENITTANIISSRILNSNLLEDFKDELLLKCFASAEVIVRQDSAIEFASIKSERRRFTVILINTFDDFLKTFKMMSPEHFWFSGFYLIVLTAGNFAERDDIFKLLWMNEIYNANAIFEDENGKIHIKTFIPFNDRNCNDTTSVSINELKISTSNFFPHKIKNLRKCSIRAGVTQNKPYIFKESKGKIVLYGRDIDLVNGLADALNFRVEFVYVNDSGALHANGSSSGTFKMLLENKVDLIVGNNNLKPNRLKFITNTTPYIASQITFLVPPGSQLTSFETLFRPLRFKVWLCLAAYFAFGLVVIFIINRQSESVRSFVYGRNVRNPYINMLNAIFGGAQKVEPRENFSRFLLMMFLIFCLVIRNLYTGSLYRFLQTDIHHSEVESIDEMMDEGFKFYVSTSSLDLFEGDPKFDGR